MCARQEGYLPSSLPPFLPRAVPGVEQGYRRIFVDVIVYIFPHYHTTSLIEAVAINMN